jgi:CheY-like chemotaxis protein
MDKGTIVFIDDNPMELRLAEEAYRDTKYSYELKTFSDAAKALEWLKKNYSKIFLILSDIRMPGMDGTELLEKINEDKLLKLETIPFIFLSNSTNRGDVEKAYSLAAQGYFQKPMDNSEMVLLLQKIISYWTSAHIPREFIVN